MASSIDSLENLEPKKCNICNNSQGKYVCPKCELLYCSLLCYKSERHSECSEKFYETNVRDVLEKSMENPEKMLGILKNIQQQELKAEEDLDSDDDEECSDLSKRMENIDLDDSEKVWERLTEDERKEFVAFLQSKEASEMIPKWQPWWIPTSKIQVLDENSKFPCLKILESYKNLIQKKPEENVKYNLVNILGGYLLTTRYFNGEYMEFPREAISYLATISRSLISHQNFDNFEDCVRNIEEICVHTDWIYVDAENLQTMREDLQLLIESPENFYSKCAMSDLHSLLKKSLEQYRRKEPIFANHFPEIEIHSRSVLKKYLKRIEYFLGYVQYIEKLTF